MSLSSALFSGISGLSTLGNSMTVIGDNIANVNTVGFKSSRVTFQDVLSQTVATTAGTAQVGRGTSLADITSSFSQGSFESTDSTTDLAIGGEGFFIVRDPGSQSEFYTRAGEFRFDKDGNFSSPAGYIVRGWELDEITGEDKGSITDVILKSFTSSPQKTDRITLITNLDADIATKTLSLANTWDGTATTPLVATSYEYQSTMKAYDTLGSTHDITIYFDKVSGTTWEYIVTSNPSEDKRTGFANTTSSGLLARGQIVFSESAGTVTGTGLTLEELGATGHTQSAGTFAISSDTNKGTGSTLLGTDVTVAYDNQIAMTTSGTVEMEFDQLTGQAITGAGAISTLIVNNDAALTYATGGTPLKVTKTPILNNLSDTMVSETATYQINTPSNVTSDGTAITLSWNAGTWTLDSAGGYSSGIIIGTDNNATEIDLELGGSGADDMTILINTGGGTLNNGETITFAIDKDNWTVSDVPASYTLASGTNIGSTSATEFTLDLNGGGTDITVTTTGTAGGDEVTFNIQPGNWTVATVPAAYDLDIGDNVTGTRTGFALDLASPVPSGNDLTFSLAKSAVEGDKVSFAITGSSNWTSNVVGTNGYYDFTADFLGGSSTTMDIELDIGVKHDGSSFVPDSLTSTQFRASSTTTFQSANGYGAGDLQSVTVGTDGALTGQYSNGQVLSLYRVALAKFQNNQALFKVGGNLFRETRLSGDPITGKPGSSGLGSISPNSLEQSNVDIATEFVKMITTQRGFQANSKIITVTDQMLAELINLKR
jgi:flagellar hook protein FlgE